ncbi:MAG: hypothetical protein P4M10_07595, partial [Verrucomicrobiae bacterium]|nr:hypothetical protein [Verrucomicrobiae bacterium]
KIYSTGELNIPYLWEGERLLFSGFICPSCVNTSMARASPVSDHPCMSRAGSPQPATLNLAAAAILRKIKVGR